MNLRRLLSFAIRHHWQWQLQLHAEVRELKRVMAAETPDNPALKGFKVYSQFDEDGIIEEIFRRIGAGRSFIELGCGNGLENNTHYLVLKGWRGTWIDANPKHIRAIARFGESTRLRAIEMAATKDNIGGFAHPELDFFSIDIDGNDYEVLEAFVSRCAPKVICAEYNAKFPPPAVVVARPGDAAWSGDDYQGASLQAIVNLLAGYTLVSCGLSGSNAFFVRKDLSGEFATYSVDALYQPYRAHLIFLESGHPPSYKFIAHALKPSKCPGDSR